MCEREKERILFARTGNISIKVIMESSTQCKRKEYKECVNERKLVMKDKQEKKTKKTIIIRRRRKSMKDVELNKQRLIILLLLLLLFLLLLTRHYHKL